MSEYIENISIEDLKKYWATFFEDKLSLEELDKMFEEVSNTNFDKIINENRKIDTSIVDSLIWGKIKNEETFQEIFEIIIGGNQWVYFFEPIVKKYTDILVDEVNNSNIISDANPFLLQTIASIVGQLNQISYQTIIAELYYAKQDQLLKGETKEERGEYFSNVLLKDNNYRKEVYSNYPELARVLDVKTKFIVDFVIKVVKDTEKEIGNIEKTINNGNKLGKIREIHMGEGDTHNGGKSVIKLVFDTDKAVIYKPHNLDIDKKYYDFIEWINNQDITDKEYDNLLAGKVYSVDDAGWAEFIEHIECDTEEEVENFYYRIGRILCILHTLNGNDMHHENLIAHKDIPVLIDLETLMHPVVEMNYSAQSAFEKAFKEVKESVTNTHLLPSKMINSKNDKVLEIGGLGAAEEQESPYKGKFIANYGTDEVKVEKRYGKIMPKNNNPVYNERTIEAKTYKKEIICGFKEMYTWILENKEVYKNKVQELFGKSEVRVIYRATNVYAQLLMSSFHPDLLTNYADRFIFLHRIATDYKMRNLKMVQLEVKELMQGDIPFFTINAENKKINNHHLRNIDLKIDESTMQTVLNKIDDMSKVRMYRQISAINISFMSEKDTGHIKTPVVFNESLEKEYDDKYLVEVAKKIGDYILNNSIQGEKDGVKSRTWLQEQDYGLGFKLFGTASGDIYTGLCGISLFYNYLWNISGDIKYKEAVEEVVASIIETIPTEEDATHMDKVKTGAFNGIGGMIYTLFHIGEASGTNKYTSYIHRLLNMLQSYIKDSDVKDVINLVGNLGIMVSIYEKTEDKIIKEESLKISNRIFEILLKSKIKLDGKSGVTWSEKGYTGYSHGNSGVIAQLYRWYEICNDEKVLDLINEALLYERFMYSQEDKNWYKSNEEKHFLYGWCHGAPGILLSKVQLKKLGYMDEKIDEEIRNAITSTIKDGLGRDISLCHGDIGNMAIIRDAAILLNDKKLYKQSIMTIKDIAKFIEGLLEEESFKENDYSGLMIGVAGIGYELLRSGREEEIPNILGLE